MMQTRVARRLRAALQVALPRAAIVLALAVVVAAAMAPAQAQPAEVRDDTLGLPDPMVAPPRTADLVGFEVNSVTRHRFAIDPQSLRPAGRRFVRVTLVVTSSSGVSNVSYEAFDCERATHKLLALGATDGAWRAVADAPWLAAQGSDRVLRQHLVVLRAVCAGGAIAGDTASIVRRLISPPDDHYRR